MVPRSITDDVDFIYILQKVHGSPRSLTDEAGIIVGISC